MSLNSWLKSLKQSPRRARQLSRRSQSRHQQRPPVFERLEDRRLLAGITYTQVIGADNPMNGVDVGRSAAPALGDVDGDGDLDLFLGSSGKLQVDYFENTGTASDPAFTERTGASNPMNGIPLGRGQTFNGLALGDVTGDGAPDLFSGSVGKPRTVKSHVDIYTNDTPAFTFLSGFSVPNYRSQPTLGDMDADGDLDVVVGDNGGFFHYYENTGTANAPVFVRQTGADNPLSGLRVEDANSVRAAAPTLGDVDGDGDLDLFAGGTFLGRISYFENTGTASAPVFIARIGPSNPMNGVDVGSQARPELGDVDGDGDLDLFIGNEQGKVLFYEASGLNQAPTVANPIDDVMANEDQLDSVLDLTNTFSDPDAGDTLTLIATSADDSLVTATMDGTNLVLDYQLDQSGTTTVTVRATDQGGLFVEDIFTVNVASSEEQLVSLVGDVNLLRDDGVLNNGNANALTSKLEKAQKKVEAGKINAAVNQLNAFRNQVEAFRNSGKLTDDQADDLLESLDALLTSLLED